MNNDEIRIIIEKLESKEIDCKNFIKKYQSRNMNELLKYYEGAEWAIQFALLLIKKEEH